jgi:Cu(I)/Ag(I) efflux system membrane fusion protein
LRPGDYAAATLQLGTNPAEPTYDAALAGKWISPRHPQIVRDAPGACPLCGDALRPAADYGYADAPPPTAETLSVPRSAVLAVGPQAVVYVEESPGEFALRQVATGVHSDARIEILAGLEPGEQVATAGAFLIDSQMQLTGKPSLRDPGETTPPTSEAGAAHAH